MKKTPVKIQRKKQKNEENCEETKKTKIKNKKEIWKRRTKPTNSDRANRKPANKKKQRIRLAQKRQESKNARSERCFSIREIQCSCCRAADETKHCPFFCPKNLRELHLAYGKSNVRLTASFFPTRGYWAGLYNLFFFRSLGY